MKRLAPGTHQQAYDFWARHFDDPALMANRAADYTRFKIANVMERLPLTPDARVLDVGPGDATLFRMIAPRVAGCVGVDPSPAAVDKLSRMFRVVPNVGFRAGSCEDLPCGDGEFDVVVVNSVIMLLPDVEAARRAIGELLRACRPGGTVYVGEVPFVSELGGGLVRALARKLRELGWRHVVRHFFVTYFRPVLRGGPLLVEPRAPTLHLPEDVFRALCAGHDVELACHRHREPRGPSLTRNDYVLRRAPAA